MFTEGGREVAEHTAWGAGWNKNIEITKSLEAALMAAAWMLHDAAEKHMTGLHGLLEAKKSDGPEDGPVNVDPAA